MELEDDWKARPNNYHRGLMLMMILCFDASRLAEGNAKTAAPAVDELMARLMSSQTER